MSKWIAEFELEDGDTMPEHMDLNYMGAKIDFHCRPMWIPVSEKYPKIEDECKYFLITDDKGKVSIQKFLLSLEEEPQPYFSGMVNVIAWMPLPEPYKVESEEV